MPAKSGGKGDLKTGMRGNNLQLGRSNVTLYDIFGARGKTAQVRRDAHVCGTKERLKNRIAPLKIDHLTGVKVD